jgi:hypothetical protein
VFASTYLYSNSPLITIRVPAGAVAAYTSGWDVTADTAVNGETTVYGSGHNRIVITDAP